MVNYTGSATEKYPNTDNLLARASAFAPHIQPTVTVDVTDIHSQRHFPYGRSRRTSWYH